MFCKNCGEAVDEGKTFCTKCGAPMTQPAPVGAAASPPGPPPSASAPGPGFSSGYGPGWQPPAGPTHKGNGGLIIGIVAAVIIVLAGVGVGVYFGFFRDGDKDAGAGQISSTLTTVATGSTTTSAGLTTSTGAQTTSSVAGGTTVQTIPSFTTTTGGPTSTATTVDATTAYLTAQDAIVLDLQQDDTRIPQLATQINNTAPKVPVSVRDELQSMIDSLDEDDMTLASLDRPAALDEAFSWLQEAVMHMVNRVSATIEGIEAMWDSGKISSSTPYFDTGRAERDAYRSALDKYHAVLPIE